LLYPRKQTSPKRFSMSANDPKATLSREFLDASRSSLAYSVRGEKRSDRDTDNVTDSLLRRRLTEIEQYWLKQRRQERFDQLGRKDLAIIDGEDPLLHFVVQSI